MLTVTGFLLLSKKLKYKNIKEIKSQKSIAYVCLVSSRDFRSNTKKITFKFTKTLKKL